VTGAPKGRRPGRATDPAVVRSVKDPLARAQAAAAAMAALSLDLEALADLRADAVAEVVASGVSRSEVARRLGVTPAIVTRAMARAMAGTGR
jgi:hypothetical protein